MRAPLLAAALGACAPMGPSTATVYRTTSGGTAFGASSHGGGGGGDSKLFGAGLITLGVSYASTVAISQTVSATLFTQSDRDTGADTTVSKLWVPVIGAWDGLIYNETHVRDACHGNCWVVTAGSIGVGIGAAAQTTGLILTIVGAFRMVDGRGGGGDGKVLGGGATPMVIAPEVLPGGGGLAVTGSF